MIPITSSAGWVLLYSLCTSVGSRVATERQIEAPPRLSLVASTAMAVHMPKHGHHLAGHVHLPVPVGVGVAGWDRVLGVAALVDVQPNRLEPGHRLPGRPDSEGDLHIDSLGLGGVA